MKIMKKEKNIETKAKSQKPDSIKDALSSQIQTRNRMQFNYAIPQSPLLWRGRGEAFDFTIGKAPPGSARSPGAARGHPPENKAGPPGRARSPGSLGFPEHPPDVIFRPDRFWKPVRSGTSESFVLNPISLTIRQLTDITDKHRMQFLTDTNFNFLTI